MEMNVLVNGTPWRSLALVSHYRVKYVDHLHEHFVRSRTPNKNVRFHVPNILEEGHRYDRVD